MSIDFFSSVQVFVVKWIHFVGRVLIKNKRQRLCYDQEKLRFHKETWMTNKSFELIALMKDENFAESFII